jgi:alcohol dehydrogenase, propanol-preferring
MGFVFYPYKLPNHTEKYHMKCPACQVSFHPQMDNTRVRINANNAVTDNMGADAVIDFVNASKTETDMHLLRRRVKVVLVRLFGGELKLNLVTMPTRAYKLIGSYIGSITDLIELVSLAERVIRPITSNRLKLEQATEALIMLKDGKILGRGVINL